MGYADWLKEFVAWAGGSPIFRARLWNLENEYRARADVDKFCTQLGAEFDAQIRLGNPPQYAAKLAFETACGQLASSSCPLLGLLPVGGSVPAEVFTHIPLTDYRRYYASGHVSPTNPPRRLRFSAAFKIGPSGPVHRFIWVTFEEAGDPSLDPTEVKRQLGLSHFPEGDYLYRFWLNVAKLQLYVPSCLDARLSEAWSPPPKAHSHPWGLTRDLESGIPGKPELLTEVVDHAAVKPIAELVSPPRMLVAIEPLNVDFMARR